MSAPNSGNDTKVEGGQKKLKTEDPTSQPTTSVSQDLGPRGQPSPNEKVDYEVMIAELEKAKKDGFLVKTWSKGDASSTGVDQHNTNLPKYDGFVPTEEVVKIYPKAPQNGLRWKIERKVPRVMLPVSTAAPAVETKYDLQFILTKYRGYHENNPKGDLSDTERFIFCGSDGRQPYFQMHFMRVSDLEQRLIGDPTVYYNDRSIFKDQGGCPFPLWTCQGKLEEGTDSRNLFKSVGLDQELKKDAGDNEAALLLEVEDGKKVEDGKLTPGGKKKGEVGNLATPGWNPKEEIRPSTSKTNALTLEERKKTPFERLKSAFERKQFMYYCGLARQAQISPSDDTAVMARFWDKRWEDQPKLHLTLVIPTGLANKISTYKFPEGTRTLSTSLSTAEDKARQVVNEFIGVIKEKRKFKPDLTIEFRGKLSDEKMDTLGLHPNQLYSLLAPKGTVNELKTTYKGYGLRAVNRRIPDSDQAEAATKKMLGEINRMKGDNEAKKEDLKTDKEGTTTNVTQKRINVSQKYPREPSQIRVMGNQSPNLLVETWWGTKGEQVAEWLHRSAFSYGGLQVGPKGHAVDANPLSSQDTRNLIIGTVEANTAMLRTEMFIKRLAYYAESTSVEPKITVKTTIPLRPVELWMSNHSWLAPRLKYVYSLDPGCTPVCQRDVEFQPFSREAPTRLEAELDKVFEHLIYGWGTIKPSSFFKKDQNGGGMTVE